MQKIVKQVPAVITTNVDPDLAFKVAITAAQTVSEASMAFIAAGVAYMLNACHLQPEKERIERAVARDTLKTELNKAKSIGDQMLWRYLQVIEAGFSTISEKGKFPAVVQAFAKKESADEAAKYVLHVFTHDWGCKSMNKLRKELGIPVGEQNAGGNTVRAKPIAQRATQAVQGIAKALAKKEGKGAMTPARREAAIPQVAVAVANALPVETLVTTIVESLNRLAGLDNVSPADIRQLFVPTAKVVGVLTAKAKLGKRKPADKPKASTKAVIAAKAKAAKPATVTAH